MVHTSSKVEDLSNKLSDELRCVRNIPFELVPKELIEQIRPYADPPSYEKWLGWCPYFNKMPSYWNIAFINEEDQVMAFYYGTWDPCGAQMHIIRMTVHPKVFKIGGEIAKRFLVECKKLAKEFDVRRIYGITCRYKAFLRKLPNDVEVVEARVVEVLNV